MGLVMPTQRPVTRQVEIQYPPGPLPPTMSASDRLTPSKAMEVAGRALREEGVRISMIDLYERFYKQCIHIEGPTGGYNCHRWGVRHIGELRDEAYLDPINGDFALLLPTMHQISYAHSSQWPTSNPAFFSPTPANPGGLANLAGPYPKPKDQFGYHAWNFSRYGKSFALPARVPDWPNYTHSVDFAETATPAPTKPKCKHHHRQHKHTHKNAATAAPAASAAAAAAAAH